MTNEFAIRMDVVEPELPGDKPIYRVAQESLVMLNGGMYTPSRRKALRHAKAILLGRLAIIQGELDDWLDDQEDLDPMDLAKAELTRQGEVA